MDNGDSDNQGPTVIIVYLKTIQLATKCFHCVYIVQCQADSKVDNGNLTCSLGNDGIHSFEDTCSITCNTGYTLTGSNTRMCLSNGSWSGMDGRCDRGIVTTLITGTQY